MSKIELISSTGLKITVTHEAHVARFGCGTDLRRSEATNRT